MTVTKRVFKTVLVDLDDCCYRNEKVPELVRERIQEYMQKKLGLPHDQIQQLCLEMYTKHGTTMAGLVAEGHPIDYDDWHAHVHHSLPYTELLHRDDRLREMLNSIRLPKFIFTNADRKHAQICLDIMGIADCFEGVISFESIMEHGAAKGIVQDGRPVLCKPQRQAIELALEQAHADPETTLYLDDSTRNVAAGHNAGIFSILVGKTGANIGADREVLDILDLPTALPELWQQFEQTSLDACQLCQSQACTCAPPVHPQPRRSIHLSAREPETCRQAVEAEVDMDPQSMNSRGMPQAIASNAS
ncbi:hypothetical protein WJX72_009320 [[Myrmecia] bisecta]|uniref:Pyrimidine 5-nucleotidase n=1 Tax=[Myrmecia] bisecta TaxID=41462 RepID=A0AAW1QG04_9CHLO